MTDHSDPPLGFCESCGAKRIMARQGHCASCGQKLLQPSEMAFGPVPAAAATQVAPVAQAVPAAPVAPAISVAPAPAPVASPIPEQSVSPPEAVAAAFVPIPPLLAPFTAPTAAPPWAATAPGDAAATPPPAAYSSLLPPPPPAAAYVPPPSPWQPPVPAWPQDYQQPGPGATSHQHAAPQPEPALAASSRHPKLLIALALGVVVVLVAAGALIFVAVQPGGIPAGTVQGRIVDSSGVPAAGISLQLLEVTGQSGGTADTVTTDHKVVTDENGRFAFDKVEAGKYMIIDLNISIPLNDLLNGTGPSLDTMLIRGPDGTALRIDVPASQGLHLGDVTIPAS